MTHFPVGRLTQDIPFVKYITHEKCGIFCGFTHIENGDFDEFTWDTALAKLILEMVLFYTGGVKC